MRLSLFALYCGLMLGISAFSIDILLPSLLSISTGLDAPLEVVQLTIPVYMLALGLGNPVFGLLSDRIGRRPGIFIGLGIYVFGAAVCLFAGGVDWLLAGRFLQGFGAACAPVICRAMIRDKFEGVELAKTMAVASMFFALGPMLAPLLGYVVSATAGWRAIFLLLIFFSGIMILATWRLQETLSPNERRERNLASALTDAKAVFYHPQSLIFILLSCIATAIILTFLTQAPVVFANFGIGGGKFAILLSVIAVGIVVGQLINHRLLSVFSPMSAAFFAAIVVAITTTVIWLVSVSGALNEYVFTGLIFIFNTSYLVIFSNFASLTLDPHGDKAGMASAMFGFCTYIGGSLLTVIITFATQQNTTRWAFFFMLLCLVLLAGLKLGIQALSRSRDTG